jgi:hypothetical protein
VLKNVHKRGSPVAISRQVDDTWQSNRGASVEAGLRSITLDVYGKYVCGVGVSDGSVWIKISDNVSLGREEIGQAIGSLTLLQLVSRTWYIKCGNTCSGVAERERRNVGHMVAGSWR